MRYKQRRNSVTRDKASLVKKKKKENRNSWADQKGLANFLARKFCGNFWNAEIRQALAKSYKI